MKLLITGASGFIGGRLVEQAIRDYGRENVTAFSSKPHPQCETVVYSGEGFAIGESDLPRLESVEALIHAGAFTPKSGQQANLREACDGNVRFTEKLLQLPFANLKKILYLSTLDVYAPAARITETTPTAPTTLYGQSKLDCERLVESFAAGSELASQILRIGHVYGPGEEAYAKFLPTAMRRVVAGEAVELWGDGSERRSLIYIDDVVRAILSAIPQTGDLGIINIAGGRAIAIRQLLDHVIAISGKKVSIIEREGTGATARDILFDTSKCKEHLLPAETDLVTGLRAEYAYFETLG